MGKYRTLGTLFNRVFRNDLNANFSDVEAEQLTQKARVDNLIANAEQPSEVVDARGTASVLRDRLDGVDAQLAESATKFQSQNNYDGGIFTIIDDDGLSKFMQRWKPIADAQGIKISLAVHSAAVGVSGFLTLSELKQLKSEGYDILSHAKNAIDLNTATLQEIETYWVDSKNYLINNELGDDLALVYPGGLFNISSQDKAVKVKELTRKHYKYGIDALASTSAVNQLPVDNYEVLRRVFNPATDTLNTIKANIDDAFTNKKWFILLTHIGNDAQWVDNTSPNTLNGIIDYVQGLGMPILSFSDAEKIVGNVISHGDTRTNNYHFVSKTGATKSGSLDSLIVPMSVPNMNSDITYYPKNTIKRQQISNVQDTFLSAGGVLETFRGGSMFSYQNFYVAQSSAVYRRTYNDTTGAWSSWSSVGGGSSGAKQTITPQNGWGGTLTYKADSNNMVTIEGNMTVGTNSATIVGSIPTGYRVPQTMVIPVIRTATNKPSLALALYNTGSIITTAASDNGLTAGETIQFCVSYKAG